MNRFLFAVLCIFTLTGLRSAAAAERRPNMLFIVADDLGYGELGCYGGKEIPTPHIDSLGASGTRFTSGYVIHHRIFAAMLAHLDDSVGKVLAKLRESGVEGNTLIVFLSDNGGPTKELTSSNAPLRGGKGDLWDGGIRVPFIVSWKSHIPAGRVVDASVSSVDATVTALELGGAESGKAKLDGINLLPMLTNKTTDVTDSTLLWRVGKKNALRSGDWKLIRDGNEWQLYDVTHDIGETANLAARDPVRVQRMSSLWNKWNAEQIEPLWR